MVNINVDGGTPPMQLFYSEIVDDVRPIDSHGADS
jgi:hypothetical protein